MKNDEQNSNALGASLLSERLEVGIQKSKLIGDNVEILQNGGLSFWQALEATLKAYDL